MSKDSKLIISKLPYKIPSKSDIDNLRSSSYYTCSMTDYAKLMGVEGGIFHDDSIIKASYVIHPKDENDVPLYLDYSGCVRVLDADQKKYGIRPIIREQDLDRVEKNFLRESRYLDCRRVNDAILQCVHVNLGSIPQEVSSRSVRDRFLSAYNFGYKEETGRIFYTNLGLGDKSTTDTEYHFQGHNYVLLSNSKANRFMYVRDQRLEDGDQVLVEVKPLTFSYIHDLKLYVCDFVVASAEDVNVYDEYLNTDFGRCMVK